jgi:hypothetical protein
MPSFERFQRQLNDLRYRDLPAGASNCSALIVRDLGNAHPQLGRQSLLAPTEFIPKLPHFRTRHIGLVGDCRDSRKLREFCRLRALTRAYDGIKC